MKLAILKMANRHIYITILLILGLIVNLNAQDVNSIIQNHFKAIGGLEKWETVKNIKIVRSQKFSSEENFINTIYIIPNVALRHESVLETGGNQIIYCANRNVGWRINAPMNDYTNLKISNIDSEELPFLLAQTDLLYGLGKYKNPDYKIELSGSTKIDGMYNYEVKITSKEGTSIKYFFDEKTYLLTKMIGDVTICGMRMPLKSEVDFKNYKNIDGFMFPFEISISSKTVMFGQARIFNVESIKLNSEFESGLFTKPNQ